MSFKFLEKRPDKAFRTPPNMTITNSISPILLDDPDLLVCHEHGDGLLAAEARPLQPHQLEAAVVDHVERPGAGGAETDALAAVGGLVDFQVALYRGRKKMVV